VADISPLVIVFCSCEMSYIDFKFITSITVLCNEKLLYSRLLLYRRATFYCSYYYVMDLFVSSFHNTTSPIHGIQLEFQLCIRVCIVQNYYTFEIIFTRGFWSFTHRPFSVAIAFLIRLTASACNWVVQNTSVCFDYVVTNKTM